MTKKEYFPEVKWKCKLCGDIVVSNREERHKMNRCKCKKSSVDAEDYYVRSIGEVEFLKISDNKGK
jgi:hypothetical protein